MIDATPEAVWLDPGEYRYVVDGTRQRASIYRNGNLIGIVPAAVPWKQTFTHGGSFEVTERVKIGGLHTERRWRSNLRAGFDALRSRSARRELVRAIGTRMAAL